MTKKKILFENSYPGLEAMSPQLSKYIPKCKIYVEPFAGLARTAQFIRNKCETMVLSDLSIVSNEYCKKNFPKAVVTNEDFVTCMLKWDSPDTFFLIDPPWHRNIYKYNDRTCFTVKRAIEYYETLFRYTPILKGDWIICCDRVEAELNKIVSESGYPNLILEHPRLNFFGNFLGVRMCSNKEFKLQC